MNFLITDYVYPIKDPICISQKNKFYLDNPKTEKEILFLKNKIKHDHLHVTHFRLPLKADSQTVSITSLLRLIRKGFNDDKYLCEIFNNHFSAKSYDKIYEFIARIWVIARFNDEGQFEVLEKEKKKMIERGVYSIHLLDDEDPLIKNSTALKNYSHLLSLLINTEKDEYSGNCFISKNSSYDENISYMKSLLYLSFATNKRQKKKDLIGKYFHM